MSLRRRIAIAVVALAAVALALGLLRWLRDDPGYRATGVRTPLGLRLAIALLQVEARLGNREARYRLGAAYANGRGVASDLQKAREWYERASGQGHAAAQFALGDLYGLGRDTDGARAERWWRAAAEQGHFHAQYRLADVYGRGWLDGVALDPSETVRWWQRMADSGDVEFKHRLAWALSTGWGVARDPEASVRIWSRLAEIGDAESTCQLGLAYAAGAGVPRDSAQALRLWLKASDQRHRDMPDCWHALCRAYALGEGATRDEVAAAPWCRRLAADPIRNGPVDEAALARPASRSWVIVSVSGTHQKARECRELLARAFPELLRRARAGEARAEYEVGLAYLTSLGARYDRAEAFGWLRRAAAQGHAKALEAVAREEANSDRFRLPKRP